LYQSNHDEKPKEKGAARKDDTLFFLAVVTTA